MKRSYGFLAVVSLVAAVVIFILAITTIELTAPEEESADHSRTATPLESPTVSFGNPSIGPKDAQITIVEFGDYQCEACRDMSPILKEILDSYRKEVRLVWKDLPNRELHSHALNAALAARCAGEQGAYWQYHDTVFANQGSISDLMLQEAAAAINLDTGKFGACLNGRDGLPIVERDIEEAIRLSVDATPYFFVGDRRVSGSISEQALRAMIEEQLASPAPASDN